MKVEGEVMPRAAGEDMPLAAEVHRSLKGPWGPTACGGCRTPRRGTSRRCPPPGVVCNHVRGYTKKVSLGGVELFGSL